MKNFYGEIFYHWIFSSSIWLPFQLDKKPLHIKMEVCERNSCVCVTITTRDAVSNWRRTARAGARVTSECETEKITKVRYAILFAMKNILCCNGLASVGFALCLLKFFLYFTICLSYNVWRKTERDNVSLGLEYLLYVEIFQACLLTNVM